MNLAFFIARRYLAKQQGAFSSFIIRLAIVATGLSVAVMVVAIAVVMGFKYAITEKLYSFMGHVHVVPFSGAQTASLTFSQPIYADSVLQQKMAALPKVRSVTPFAAMPAIIQVGGQLEGLQLKGVNSKYSFPEGITVTGKAIDYSDTLYARQLLLSRSTADRLKVTTGDTVQVDFVQNGIPRIRRLLIAGLYHSGMEEVDKLYAICDIRLLQRINNWPADSINGYQIDLHDAAFADTVSNYIHYNLIEPPMESYTTRDNYSFIFDWLDLQTINGRILLSIMAVVAIINLGTVLLILIVNRAAMIGVLKALGMQFGDIRNIFLSLAGLIGGAGIILGNILALGLCWLQLRFGLLQLPEATYYMKHVPIRLIWWHVVVIDIATLALCVLCMWLPALYIRRVHPARVLQFK